MSIERKSRPILSVAQNATEMGWENNNIQYNNIQYNL